MDFGNVRYIAELHNDVQEALNSHPNDPIVDVSVEKYGLSGVLKGNIKKENLYGGEDVYSVLVSTYMLISGYTMDLEANQESGILETLVLRKK